MRMTAAICTRDRPDLVVRAVSSVLDNDHGDFELLVIDQSSSAGEPNTSCKRASARTRDFAMSTPRRSACLPLAMRPSRRQAERR